VTVSSQQKMKSLRSPPSHTRRRMLLAGLVIAVLLPDAGAKAAAGLGLASAAYQGTIGQPGQSELHPGGIDVDDAGNVYVADTGNDRIAKYPAGSATAEWITGTRGGPRSDGSFADPRDVAVSATHLYVADNGNGIVQVLDLQGHYLSNLPRSFKSVMGVTMGTDGAGHALLLVSDGGTGNVDIFDAGDRYLRSIPPRNGAGAGTRDAATDSQGNIYALDYRGHKVHKYNPAGTWLQSWGGETACQKITGPYGIAVDDQDRVYVASSNLNIIRVFTSDGVCIRSYGSNGTAANQFTQLRRVAVAHNTATPNVYGADLWGIKVTIFAFDGTLASPLSRLGDPWRPPPGGLNEVPGVAVFGTYVYAVDLNNHRLERWDLDGGDPRAWGQKGTGGATLQLNWPMGVGVNPANGHVWVADTHNSRLVELGANGEGPLQVFGSVGSGTNQVNWPIGITFDSSGNIYVADSNNGRIISWGPTMGFRWQLKGLRAPKAVAYDPSGNRILAADSGASRIVAINPATGAQLATLPIGSGSAAGRILGPRGIAVEPDGDMWISSPSLNRVDRFTAAGAYSGETLGDTRGLGANEFNLPSGLAFSGGRLYVGDSWNSRIQAFQL